jgi:hypothetical protein
MIPYIYILLYWYCTYESLWGSCSSTRVCAGHVNHLDPKRKCVAPKSEARSPPHETACYTSIIGRITSKDYVHDTLDVGYAMCEIIGMVIYQKSSSSSSYSSSQSPSSSAVADAPSPHSSSTTCARSASQHTRNLQNAYHCIFSLVGTSH